MRHIFALIIAFTLAAPLRAADWDARTRVTNTADRHLQHPARDPGQERQVAQRLVDQSREFSRLMIENAGRIR